MEKKEFVEELSRLHNINIDANKFTSLYNRYQKEIHANICRVLGSDSFAEDIQQEVFSLLWKQRYSVSQEQSIGGWLYQTSYYKSLEYIRQKAKIPIDSFNEIFLDIKDKVITDNTAEKTRALRDAIKYLPDRKRKAFILCKIRGYTYERAADIMGISKETIRGYLKESMKLVRLHIFNNRTF